jgi:hypothetical protein
MPLQKFFRRRRGRRHCGAVGGISQRTGWPAAHDAPAKVGIKQRMSQYFEPESSLM